LARGFLAVDTACCRHRWCYHSCKTTTSVKASSDIYWPIHRESYVCHNRHFDFCYITAWELSRNVLVCSCIPVQIWRFY
jgi:hypothetical protein